MGLDVYYPRDIQNALLAAEQAMGSALRVTVANDDPYGKGYQEGYRAALTTLALAFGLVEQVRQEIRISHALCLPDL